jgi:hypothetical protein
MAVMAALIAIMSRLTGGREFTDDLASIHYLADHPFALIGYDTDVLKGVFSGFRAYPPLQPLLIALALAPFRLLPDFWSHRIATTMVLLGCIYQGRAAFPGLKYPTPAAHRLFLMSILMQLACAGAVWAQLDDAIAAFVVFTIARYRPKTPTRAVLAAGALLFCAKVILLPVAASLLVVELRSSSGWKKTSTVLALACFMAILVANRLTLGLLGNDALLRYDAPDPAMGVGLTSLLWSLGFHAAAIRGHLIPFALAILVAVLLAAWNRARIPANRSDILQSAILAAPIAGRYALVFSQLLIGFSQPEYFPWITAGWLLLASATVDTLLFRQITMLSIAGAVAWGTNICYGLGNAVGGPKRRLLEIALRLTSESGLRTTWYICVVTTTVLLIGVVASDFTVQRSEASLG